MGEGSEEVRKAAGKLVMSQDNGCNDLTYISLISTNGNRCPLRPGTRIDYTVVVTNMTLFLPGEA